MMATRVEAIQVTARTLRQGSWLNLGHVGRGSEDRWFQPQLGSWASGCAVNLRLLWESPSAQTSLCVSAFSCPVKMNQLDSLNYNMNIKLSKETHFPRTQEAGPQHTHRNCSWSFPQRHSGPFLERALCGKGLLSRWAWAPASC